MAEQVKRIGVFKKIVSPLKEFINDSKFVGILLLFCTIVSFYFSNWGPTQESYISFWHLKTPSLIGNFTFPSSIHTWINDFLMSFYFFIVSMEIKRELTIGELSNFKKASLPFFGAVGGMVVPAFIFFVFNRNTPYENGWGIPMATDIAFSLGVLSLLGKKVPTSIKILLMALAIIDDLGGIITIAIIYSNSINWIFLLVGFAIITLMILINVLKWGNEFVYILLFFFLWYCLFNSGVHPTISGVVLGFVFPKSKVGKMESLLHDPINFIILPLFVLANTSLIFPEQVTAALSNKISIGILLGLTIGKPLGIFLFSKLAVFLKLSQLPSNISWWHIYGMGTVGGIGFTIAIFITSLAISDVNIIANCILTIVLGSVLSGIFGAIIFNILSKKNFVSMAADHEYDLEFIENDNNL